MATSQITPFPLRLPSELRDELARLAGVNGRSVNAEIVDRLSKSLETQPLSPGGPAELSADSVQQIADAVCEAVAKRVTQAIPGSLDLWDTSDIASYLKRSADTVRREIATQAHFPKPVRLPGAGQSHALYIAREVIRWAESHQEPDRAKRSSRK